MANSESVTVRIDASDIAPVLEKIERELEKIKADCAVRYAKAFQLWGEGFRAEPDKFITEQETAAADVSLVSLERADYFVELLAEVDRGALG